MQMYGLCDWHCYVKIWADFYKIEDSWLESQNVDGIGHKN